MLDSLKRLRRGGDPSKGVLRSPGDYLYIEVNMEDFVPDWLLPWKAQLGSSKEKYIVGAITYKQHIDGAANPNMTADVLLWEGQMCTWTRGRRPKRRASILLSSTKALLRVTRGSWRSAALLTRKELPFRRWWGSFLSSLTISRGKRRRRPRRRKWRRRGAGEEAVAGALALWS
jgi:hypothetical protein